MRISVLYFIFVLLLISCERGPQNDAAYTQKIYSWFASYYEQIDVNVSENSKEVWYLYFDDALTCQTCKLEILSTVRENTAVHVIMNFEDERHLNAFKKAYQLQNDVFNVHSKAVALPTPFLFRLDGLRMYDLHVLDDNFLKRRSIAKLLKHK
ncbi:MAG: hypothetical protein ACXIT9_13245 [Nitritalea sp.]